MKLTWYDGDKRPPLQQEHNMPNYHEGTLFVGSEGTLGVITEIGLRLYGRAEAISAAVVNFADVRSAAEATIF